MRLAAPSQADMSIAAAHSRFGWRLPLWRLLLRPSLGLYKNASNQVGHKADEIHRLQYQFLCAGRARRTLHCGLIGGNWPYHPCPIVTATFTIQPSWMVLLSNQQKFGRGGAINANSALLLAGILPATNKYGQSCRSIQAVCQQRVITSVGSGSKKQSFTGGNPLHRWGRWWRIGNAGFQWQRSLQNTDFQAAQI